MNSSLRAEAIPALVRSRTLSSSRLRPVAAGRVVLFKVVVRKQVCYKFHIDHIGEGFLVGFGYRPLEKLPHLNRVLGNAVRAFYDETRSSIELT